MIARDNQMRDWPEAFRAQAANDDEVLRAFEGAVFLPVFDDSGREFWPDAGQLLQLFSGSCVEVDRSGRLLAGESCGAERQAEKQRQGGKSEI